MAIRFNISDDESGNMNNTCHDSMEVVVTSRSRCVCGVKQRISCEIYCSSSSSSTGDAGIAMQYIVHGSKNQNYSNVFKVWSEFSKRMCDVSTSFDA